MFAHNIALDIKKITTEYNDDYVISYVVTATHELLNISVKRKSSTEQDAILTALLALEDRVRMMKVLTLIPKDKITREEIID